MSLLRRRGQQTGRIFSSFHKNARVDGPCLEARRSSGARAEEMPAPGAVAAARAAEAALLHALAWAPRRMSARAHSSRDRAWLISMRPGRTGDACTPRRPAATPTWRARSSTRAPRLATRTRAPPRGRRERLDGHAPGDVPRQVARRAGASRARRVARPSRGSRRQDAARRARRAPAPKPRGSASRPAPDRLKLRSSRERSREHAEAPVHVGLGRELPARPRKPRRRRDASPRRLPRRRRRRRCFVRRLQVPLGGGAARRVGA